ncbi:MAG TPA: riboflavin synthase [Actinomycetota bacterium]|nr:riboflavin synthase [Actinomycetota bacterium]
MGTVGAVDDHRLTISCSTVPADSPIGASVAVGGVCLTVIDRADDRLSFEVSGETLARTALGRLRIGARVNLERPVTLATRLGGHLVQGHVDGVGRVASVDRDDAGGATLRVEVPAELRRYVVHKGSIAVDGVSLTVAALHDDGVSIALIPHTLAATTLGTVASGDAVHLEVDVIAKYVERLAQATAGQA